MAPSLNQKSNEIFFDQIQLENERNEFSLEGVPSGIWGSKTTNRAWNRICSRNVNLLSNNH